MLSRHERHWPRGREGGGRGSPESEDLPPSLSLDPLAEGRISMLMTGRSAPRGGARRPRAGARVAVARGAEARRRRSVPRDRHRRQRECHDHANARRASSRSLPTATEIAVRDRRRHAGRRRRRPVRLPEAAHRRRRSPGFTPNVEAIAGYKPDLVVIAYDPNGLSGALTRLGIRVARPGRGARRCRARTAQIRQLGKVTATRGRPTRSSRR